MELGLATDLMVAARSGEVVERDGYRVVRTPSNPRYHSGNALVIAAARLGEPAAWEPRFADELPGAAHRMVLVDGAPSTDALAPWLAAGFAATTSDVMVAAAVHAAPVPGLAIAPLDDWPAVVAITLASDAAEGTSGDAYAAFIAARVADQRRLVERSAARWWGASFDGGVVATLGVIAGDVGARYQDVVTELAHRGRGVAAALVAHAGAQALAAGAARLVIVVARASIAQRVYARVGFVTDGTTTTLARTA